MPEELSTDIAVVGAGLAGLAAAVALSGADFGVIVAAPAYDPMRAAADNRTTALLSSSLRFLENLDVWRGCTPHAAPLRGVRIVDDRRGLVRAPEVLFEAAEAGLADLGANVPNHALLGALHAKAASMPNMRWMPTSGVTGLVPHPAGVELHLAEGGMLRAALAVAADGRNSICRTAAGIAAHTWAYPQAAVAASVRHSRPHGGISTEFHRRQGPLTTVPLPGSASSIVWVEEPAEARRIAGLADGDFAGLLEERLQGVLGAITADGPRGFFPLAGLEAASMGARRVALVGEAAHVIPPIGAQGLNLGLRDIAALTDCLADARAEGRDIGSAQTLDAYTRARASDVTMRTAMVDLLNRSLLTDFIPAQALRGLGLHLLAMSPPLRRLAIEGGAGPAGPLPRLMRPPSA